LNSFKLNKGFHLLELLTTPRILVRCLIGDPVTIQSIDAQFGLRLSFNPELTVCPKKVNFFMKKIYRTFSSFLTIQHNCATHIQVKCNLLIVVLMLELHLG